MNILLTGASRGIGAAAFAALVRDGHLVVGHSTSGNDGLIAADFADPSAPRQLWDRAVAALGGRIRLAVPFRGAPLTCPLIAGLAHLEKHTHRASGRPSTLHRRPPHRAIPSPIQPTGETLCASMKLPERGIEFCLARDTRSRSPDFTRPPASVDRAPR